MAKLRKPIIWLHSEIKTPPFSTEARKEPGFLLGLLQDGEKLEMPQSRPMTGIGKGCHELRVRDKDTNWRVIYQLAGDEIVILHVVEKKSAKLPKRVIETCKERLAAYRTV